GAVLRDPPRGAPDRSTALVPARRPATVTRAPALRPVPPRPAPLRGAGACDAHHTLAAIRARFGAAPGERGTADSPGCNDLTKRHLDQHLEMPGCDMVRPTL